LDGIYFMLSSFIVLLYFHSINSVVVLSVVSVES
jgi:hypothetical protein